jgi:hypothetical protein
MSLLLLNNLEPHAVQVKRYENMKKIFLFLTGLLFAVNVFGQSSDFVIEAGVLKAYNGAGGDVVIPDGVIEIEESVFEECTGLTSVIIPNSVTVIGHFAFGSCPNLTSITIPNSVTGIYKGAFEYCSGLTSLTIGSNVTDIVEAAFYDCSNLTEIHSKNPTPPDVSPLTFYKTPRATCKLYVPEGSLNDYKTASGWRHFKNIFEEGTGTERSVTSDTRISSLDGAISVETNRPVQVSIFTVSGQKVYQSEIAGNLKVRLNKGAYIVTAGTTSQKVVVE